jgi:hypothetical protein
MKELYFTPAATPPIAHCCGFIDVPAVGRVPCPDCSPECPQYYAGEPTPQPGRLPVTLRRQLREELWSALILAAKERGALPGVRLQGGDERARRAYRSMPDRAGAAADCRAGRRSRFTKSHCKGGSADRASKPDGGRRRDAAPGCLSLVYPWVGSDPGKGLYLGWPRARGFGVER